jgi:hypothetical protein
VTGIKIYIEGGGQTKNLKTPLRIGFQKFLKDLRFSAKEKGLDFEVVMSGGRSDAYDKFKIAMKVNTDTYNYLLVDSESDVLETKSTWQYLKDRTEDKYEKVGEDDQCHLMVQCMETWFVADAIALKKVFKGDLDESKLPKNTNLETAEKDDVQKKLEDATNGKYHKRNKAKEILEVLDPTVIRKLKYCERLFCTLEETIRDH